MSDDRVWNTGVKVRSRDNVWHSHFKMSISVSLVHGSYRGTLLVKCTKCTVLRQEFQFPHGRLQGKIIIQCPLQGVYTRIEKGTKGHRRVWGEWLFQSLDVAQIFTEKVMMCSKVASTRKFPAKQDNKI